MSSMGRAVLACFLVLPVLIALGKACKVKLDVPSELGAEQLVGRVNLEKCMKSNNIIAISKDPDFVIIHDVLYTSHAMTLPSKRKFTILIRDMELLDEKKLHVVLVPHKMKSKKRHTREAILKRTKRMWRPLPFSCKENAIPPFPQFVQQIQSDTQENYTIFYSISGEGVDMPPVNLFFIKSETGEIYVTRTIDREEYPQFKLMGYAKTREGYSPELPLDIIIKIEDDNDNNPEFTEATFCMAVQENSKAGTIVGRVNATDRDEPGTAHTSLKYSIVSQFPDQPRMFAMNPDTGVVITTSDRLDRETTDTYKLLVYVCDMGGQHYGLSSSGSVLITVTDENDHAPTFLAQFYRVEVNENDCGIDILRIPVEDKDLVNTENWRANFTITQGNEHGYFSIRTDPTTNEGILSVVRSLNYEEIRQIDLRVGVVNQAAFIKSPTKIIMNTVPVTVIVKDVDEGPEFQPQIKYIRIQEGLPAGTEVGEYTAKDPENKNTNIRYQKLTDQYSWITIAETTGMITTNKVLDRESGEMKQDSYNVTVLATDDSGKTGTGTLVIQLVDVNDNPPEITQNDGFICTNGKNFAVIYANDLDATPNSAPFQFSLNTTSNPDIQRHWQIQSLNATSIQLVKIDELQPGIYDVPIQILDQQGYGKTHSVKIDVCDCPDGQNCAARRAARNISLGVWAILAMILAALVLLALLCALLGCLCGGAAAKYGKTGFPDDLAQENLIVSNTEAPGEELTDPNLKIPIQIVEPNRSGQGASSETQQIIRTAHTAGARQAVKSVNGGHLAAGLQMLDQGRYSYSEWQNFMQSHIDEKVYQCGQDEEIQHADDYVVPYNYEGRGSAAGSVGCCSELRGEDDRLDFLNHLEPKFRTLASVCAKK